MPPPDYALEAEALAKTGGRRVAGVDEVGRGPLAGPVLAASVVFLGAVPADLAPLIADSKALSPARREIAAAALRASPRVEIGVGAASVAEITRLNILGASLLAMRRAVHHLPVAPDMALVDGNRAPVLGCPVRSVIGGDRRSLSIAAASIIAKVLRDRLMARLALRYPAYGFERNAGYPTEAHRTALARIGASPHHRPGFGTLARIAVPPHRQRPPP